MSDEAKQYPTEDEMRQAEVPWIESAEELTAYVAALVDRPHDYGTCVYAMSMAAVAAFHHVAKKLGVTGFQASCADMDILTRTRGYKHGFIILDAEKLLYPQYDLRAQVEEWIRETEPQLAGKARERLAESEKLHPDVRARMEYIASLLPPGAEPRGTPATPSDENANQSERT